MPLTQLGMAFTAKQRAELEHQVQLTKYLVANVPVPPELLLPLGTTGLQFDGLSTQSSFFPSLSLQDLLGGHAGTVGPQYIRCLRTDGKKWQCKKPVVRGQKYCEKHVHRGRHRTLNKKGECPNGSGSKAEEQRDASGDSRSASLSSNDKSKASDSMKDGPDEKPTKRSKLEKCDSQSSRERLSSQSSDKSAGRQQSGSPALKAAHIAQAYPDPDTQLSASNPLPRQPLGQAGFRELYQGAQFQVPGASGPLSTSSLPYNYNGLSSGEQARIHDLLERSVGKPGVTHEPMRGSGPPVPRFDSSVGVPPLSNQVFSNGHAAAFASMRINRDGTVAPEGSDAPMAVLLRQERARLEREAIAAGLDYRGMSSGYTDSRDQSLRLFFDDYRGPNLPASSSQGLMQPQLSPSSPSQWQLATSALSRQGSGRLPHSSFLRDAASVQLGSPKMNGVQRQGSDSLNTSMLQRQPSNAHILANSASHVADNSTDGLPPHLAFLAQNNSHMQPVDEQRGLVRTHSLVKGGSLADRHGPHRSSLLSRQPSLQNDDPNKPWLAVSTGMGDWHSDVGGPLGEALRRTPSGTPVQPDEKPGARISQAEVPSTDFRAEQFVAEPLSLEQAPQGHVTSDPTRREDQQLQDEESVQKDFQPFNLEAGTSVRKELRGMGMEDLGPANLSLSAMG